MPPEARVFVVDDSDSVRQSLRAVLESADLEVVDYPSAEAFLDGAMAEQGDCVLADMRMPNMNGLELQHELNRRGIGVSFIIVTGHADVPLAVAAMKAGASDFIEKPFDAEALLASVKRAVDAGRSARSKAVEAKAAASAVALLTEREREVLDQLVLGKSNKVVGHELGISPRTVEVHRARLLEKMKARSLSDLVRTVRAMEGRFPAEPT